MAETVPGKSKDMSDFPAGDAMGAYGQRVRKSRLGLAFRGIVSVLIIAYLALKVHWPELVAQLVRVNLIWLIFAGFLFGVVYLLAALRWWFLLQVQGIHLSFQVVAALTFIGQFFNSFLLGAVGGDIIKMLYIQKYAPNQKTHATLSIVMDRGLGLFILLCASLLAMPWQFQRLTRNGQADSIMFGVMVIFGLCLVMGLTMAVAPFHRVPPSVRAMWNRIPHRHIIELVVSGFRQHGVALHLTLASLATGTAMTAVLVGAGYSIGVGIGLTVTYLQMLIIMTVVICVISLPISIGGHGVREGIFVIMFAAFGAISIDRQVDGGQETAILFSLLFFATPLIWSLVGGIVYLVFQHDYDLAVSPDH